MQNGVLTDGRGRWNTSREATSGAAAFQLNKSPPIRTTRDGWSTIDGSENEPKRDVQFSHPSSHRVEKDENKSSLAANTPAHNASKVTRHCSKASRPGSSPDSDEASPPHNEMARSLGRMRDLRRGTAKLCFRSTYTYCCPFDIGPMFFQISRGFFFALIGFSRRYLFDVRTSQFFSRLGLSERIEVLTLRGRSRFSEVFF